MDTERRVLELLKNSKVKLGAIEDAVEDAKTKIDQNIEVMEQIAQDLYSDYDDAKMAIINAQSDLGIARGNFEIYFDNAEAEYLENAKELDDLGIPYSNRYEGIRDSYRSTMSSIFMLTALDARK